MKTIPTEENADIVFINTCSIRDNAEQKIRTRLSQLKGNKKKKQRTHRWHIGLHG